MADVGEFYTDEKLSDRNCGHRYLVIVSDLSQTGIGLMTAEHRLHIRTVAGADQIKLGDDLALPHNRESFAAVLYYIEDVREVRAASVALTSGIRSDYQM